MPVFSPHYLLQFGGDLRGDIWSCGLRLSTPGALDPPFLPAPDMDDIIEDLAADISTWMLAAGSGWSSASKLRFVKLNRIAANGHYADQENTNVKYFDTLPYPTGAAGGTYPNQVAMVVSWVTDATRGRASKGRVYVPTPTLGLQGGVDRFVGSDVQAAANAAAAFINNVNNQPGIDGAGFVAVVASGVDGTRRPITAVRVGDVPDTQRRRRNAVDEVYFAADVA